MHNVTVAASIAADTTCATEHSTAAMPSLLKSIAAAPVGGNPTQEAANRPAIKPQRTVVPYISVLLIVIRTVPIPDNTHSLRQI